MNITAALVCLRAVVKRELLRFVSQRSRFLASLVRPLIWLLVFAAGFRAALGLSIIPPYQTYITYETYIVPGLCGMIMLFSGMQSALSLVYDREMGSMRLLLTSPFPRWWLLGCKLLAGICVSSVQVYTFLAIAAAFDLVMPIMGYVYLLPALLLSGLMLGSISLCISANIRQLENFAGVMNFIIFPMFFLSTALYPIWRMAESSPLLAIICQWNPFSHAIELIRFSLYETVNPEALVLVSVELIVFFCIAVIGYNPAVAIIKKRITQE